jgi:hypothetical protein
MLKQKSVSQWDAGRGSVHGRSHHGAQTFFYSSATYNFCFRPMISSTWISCIASPGEVEFPAAVGSTNALNFYYKRAVLSLFFKCGWLRIIFMRDSTRHHFLPTSRGYQYSRLLIPPTLARLVRERASERDENNIY